MDHDEDKLEPVTPPAREPTAHGPRPAGEGVRIIGAEEAAAALESGHAEGRRPSDAPRFGDVPPAPVATTRPALRFPLDDPDREVESSGVVLPPPESEPTTLAPPAPELPHWTEPATGEVPRILAGAEPTAPEAGWTGLTRTPRWRDQGDDWDETEFGDASVLADDETRLGALDTSRTEHSDMFSFDEPEPVVPVEPPPLPTRIRSGAPRDPAEVVTASRPAARDNGVAIVIGVALGGVFLLLAIAGPKFALIYSIAVVVLCTGEIFAVMRRAGYRPATLLGIVATISLSAGAYAKGERALPLIMVLTIMFTLLWYLSGVVASRPTINVAATLLGFAWPGFLGSYAALLLRPGSYIHPRDGLALLLAAVLCTVANDIGAYGFGRTFGRTPLAPSISPNKTLEGYLGGMLCTVLVGAGLVGRIHPMSVGKGFWLGLGIAVVAPLGDLCESMVKRDIGVKDMGTLLPGHGGVMDRFDALLFALPTTYYLAQVLKVGA